MPSGGNSFNDFPENILDQMLFPLHIFSFLDSTFFVLDSTFWLDSTLKIDPRCHRSKGIIGQGDVL